jgi:superfamily II DNA or RNA helicase
MVRSNRNEKRKRNLRERESLRRQAEERADLQCLARAAYEEGRHSTARMYCQRILRLDPRDDSALRLLLAIADRERDHPAVTRVAEKLPWREDGNLALYLAEVYARTGDLDRALEVLRHVLQSGLHRDTATPADAVARRLAQFEWVSGDPARRPAWMGGNRPGQRQEQRPPPILLIPRRRAPAPAPPAGPGPTAITAPSLGIRLDFEPPVLDAPFPSGPEPLRWSRLRRESAALELLQDYDELLCLSTLQGVDRYWFQVETVKRVLRRFHGRVLLADEVGLGKTIEAGMVIKEYLLRGLARRVLILVPPNLVGQWQEEMLSKFGLSFADAASRRMQAAFWREEPLIVASISSAKSEKVRELVLEPEYDLVVVDEAHHLRNRSTLSWQLVNGLKRRFLVLISATPVQNNLVELFNLLTLVRPGVLRTEGEFRRKYLSPKNPRLPLNRDELREVMAEVMVRNTRALVDVKLPSRHAATVAVDPHPQEARVYRLLTELLRAVPTGSLFRWEAARLLALGGSIPFALHDPLLSLRDRLGPAVDPVLQALEQVHSSAKIQKALELAQARPGKKILFAHSLVALERLSRALDELGVAHAVFQGSLSAAEKDRVIARFRDEIDLLLSTDSGGEGRNLQFCAAMINFDLPWNPMRIEQRIGRIHRIGQEREVFILNLCARGTVEERLLRLLHEKINMFELVVGDMNGILGNLSEEREFSEVILELWLHPGGPAEAEKGFAELEERLGAAKEEYLETNRVEEELFGEDLQV